MRNMAVLHSPAFSYPLPVLVRVLFNLLIFKGKILYYNKYKEYIICLDIYLLCQYSRQHYSGLLFAGSSGGFLQE